QRKAAAGAAGPSDGHDLVALECNVEGGVEAGREIREHLATDAEARRIERAAALVANEGEAAAGARRLAGRDDLHVRLNRDAVRGVESGSQVGDDLSVGAEAEIHVTGKR